ncbi:major facilitator superfamily domain-containing protein [Exophiala viscosa]|uniref:major facilitator superfamily domain-containing protein n=1 Tax=Exophiala viscosa TaxID=2486360 RepID=UPI002190F043|nr:major facilitator superfamily domain-containing protein [Exophiala viscosa]
MSKEIEPTVQDYDGTNSPAPRKPQRTWKSYVWDSLDKSPEERRFLFKLDLGLVTFSCLGYFIKFLDQSNLNNAFVSGMKEDLSMLGNQYNYTTTLWTVGYILGEIPSNILLTKIRPSIFIPSCQIVWTVLTMCLARVNTVHQLYALRFLIGLAEAGFFPGILYMFGSWYGKDEIAKRSCIFHVTGAIATMFSGYLMTAVIGLGGKGGLKGWQWLFIMDGIISLPIAFASFFMLPDFPHNTRAWYLNESDVTLSRKRMELVGRAQRQPYTKAKVLKIFTRWHIWVLPLMTMQVYLFGGGAGGVGQPIFAFYLKAHKNPKYTVAQINDYPTTTSAVQVFATLLYAYISDGPLNGARWPVMLFSATLSTVFWISLAIWNISEGWRWACYILVGQVLALVPLTLTWANEICSDDNEERALVVAAINDWQYVIGAWLPLIIWQQTDAPRYKKGMPTAVVFSFIVIGLILIIKSLADRDQKK